MKLVVSRDSDSWAAQKKAQGLMEAGPNWLGRCRMPNWLKPVGPVGVMQEKFGATAFTQFVNTPSANSVWKIVAEFTNPGGGQLIQLSYSSGFLCEAIPAPLASTSQPDHE